MGDKNKNAFLAATGHSPNLFSGTDIAAPTGHVQHSAVGGGTVTEASLT